MSEILSVGVLVFTQAIVSSGGQAIVASLGRRLVSVLQDRNTEHVTLPLTRKNPFQRDITHYLTQND